MNKPRIRALALLAAFPLLTAQADEVTLTPIMDAAVSEASPDQNYGTSNLVVGKSSGQAWESFLRFDLSGIPVNAEITGAELRLRAANFGSGGTLRVSMPDSGWAEADVKWSNRPSATTLADIALTVEDPNNAHLTLTAPVLSHLQDVVSSVTPDRGLKLSFPTATAEQFLAPLSRESGNPPQLVITYTPGPELPDFRANLSTPDDRLRAELFAAPDGAATPFELVWNTKPGVRYRLWESPDLDDWSVVAGYPVEADALGAVHEVPLTPPARFYKVEALDEQPPEIISRFPDDSDFGIRRFAGGVGNELEIQLSDVTGIDTESVALTLSGHGTFTNGGVGLALDDSGLLTLDLGGDTALGAYGATVTASLTVADPLGNSATYDWSFELEKEVVLAEGLFTFGSPDAQRAGQRVPPIPTRMLAERLGGGGPIRANDSEWTLESVAEDHLVIAYTGASAPVFTVDQYLTNMTPAKVNEIFYRKVTSIADDTAAKRLTLGTEDVPLWKVMEAGTLRLSPDDVAFEVDEDGRIIRAAALRSISASAALVLDPLEVNWGGKDVLGTYTKSDNTTGFRFGLPIDEKAPDGSDWEGILHLDQAYFRLSPAVELSAEVSLLQGVKSFTAEPSIRVDAGLEPRYEFLSASVEAEYAPEQPLWKADFRIPIGSTPAWVTFSPQLKTKAGVSAGLTGSISAGATGSYETSLAINYEKGGDPLVSVQPGTTTYGFNLIEPEVLVGGTAGAYFSLVPELDVKLVDAAGFYVNLDPTVRIDATASLSSQTLVEADLALGFDVNLNAGLSVIGIDQDDLPAIEPWELFTWEKRWAYPEAAPEDPLAILVQPQGRTVAPGANVTLEVQANHSDGVSYEWRQDGRRLYNNSSSLRLSNVTSGAGGDYQVILSRAGSAPVTSEVATVTVGNSNGGNQPQTGQWVYSGYQYSAIPSEIAASLVTDVTAIASGYDHTMALKPDGSLIAWGANGRGQIAIPVEAQSGVTAIAASTSHSVALKEDGSVVAWGENDYGQTTVPEEAQSGIIAISTNFYHTLALKEDGSVIAWGNNSFGQSTIPTEAQSGVTAIAAGSGFSVALKEDGSVVAWGLNQDGASDVPTDALSDVIAVSSGSMHTLALKEDGSVIAWGYNSYGQATVPTGAQSGVTAIAAGPSHSLATKADGSVVAWGADFYGQSTVPVEAHSGVVASAAGSGFSVALKTDGTVISWGDNTFGKLIVPAAVAPGIIAIAPSTNGNLALKQNGGVLAWGSNNYGQANVPLEAQADVIAIDLSSHALALKQNGTVIAWGFNDYGQADVPTEAQTGVIAIAAGGTHSLALKEDGSVLAWGSNASGKSTVPVEAQSGVTAVAAGWYHSVALKEDGSVVVWGSNTYGQTTVPVESQSDVVAISADSNHTVALKADGSVVAWGRDVQGESTVPVEAQSGVTAIATGNGYTVALKDDGSVVTWGGNSYGQTTVPVEALSSVDAISAGGNVTFYQLGTIP